MEFYRQYCDLKARIAPYRIKGDYEYIKTVAAVDALADRADVIHKGCNPAGRFGWGQSNDFTEQELMKRAYMYLESLERGELPLKGMFAEPGGALIDHSIVIKDDIVHVIYNRGYIGYGWDQRFVDSFGHATSTDLINWTIHTPCFASAKEGHDDYQVWSPGIVEHKGEYLMFYTGVNFNIAQAICLAKSKDLFTWNRYSKNPVHIPGDWCPWSKDKWSDCRDGMVFKDDDGMFYMYYCSSQKVDTEGRTKPVIGLASSSDAYNWIDEGAITVPGVKHAAESPFVLKHNGKYYLFYTNCGVGTAYATSDHPLKGWTVLSDNRNVLMSTGCSEVFKYKDKWYMSMATYLGYGEQYLQFAELFWNDDGTISLGRILK